MKKLLFFCCSVGILTSVVHGQTNEPKTSPWVECMSTNNGDETLPRLAPYSDELMAVDSLPARTNSKKPTKSEKQALVGWAEKIATCRRIERIYYRSNTPTNALARYDAWVGINAESLDRLFLGQLTYGQYNVAMIGAYAKFAADMQSIEAFNKAAWEKVQADNAQQLLRAQQAAAADQAYQEALGNQRAELAARQRALEESTRRANNNAQMDNAIRLLQMGQPKPTTTCSFFGQTMTCR